MPNFTSAAGISVPASASAGLYRSEALTGLETAAARQPSAPARTAAVSESRNPCHPPFALIPLIPLSPMLVRLSRYPVFRRMSPVHICRPRRRSLSAFLGAGLQPLGQTPSEGLKSLSALTNYPFLLAALGCWFSSLPKKLSERRGFARLEREGPESRLPGQQR